MTNSLLRLRHIDSLSSSIVLLWTSLSNRCASICLCLARALCHLFAWWGSNGGRLKAPDKINSSANPPLKRRDCASSKLFILIACSVWLGGCAQSVKPSKHVRIAHELIDSFSKQIEKEFDVVCIGSGGAMPEMIDEIEVAFAADRPGTIEEGRSIEILGTEKLTQMINSNEEIRPYLKNYPFPRSRALVSISYRHKSQRRHPSGIALVFQANDKIYYCVPDSQKDILVDQFVEPYEMAKANVKPKF